MARYTFSPVQIKDPSVFMMQSSIEAAFRALDRVPIINGRLIEGLALSTNEERIPHNLKRIPKGFIVVDVDSNCLVHRSSESTERYLFLTGSRVANISLWVF
tara:strand:- start:1834 stop:2139 length:306 start_codon:yes stop_codon:yes gene_type:complete